MCMMDYHLPTAATATFYNWKPRVYFPILFWFWQQGNSTQLNAQLSKHFGAHPRSQDMQLQRYRQTLALICYTFRNKQCGNFIDIITFISMICIFRNKHNMWQLHRGIGKHWKLRRLHCHRPEVQPSRHLRHNHYHRHYCKYCLIFFLNQLQYLSW